MENTPVNTKRKHRRNIDFLSSTPMEILPKRQIRPNRYIEEQFYTNTNSNKLKTPNSANSKPKKSKQSISKGNVLLSKKRHRTKTRSLSVTKATLIKQPKHNKSNKKHSNSKRIAEKSNSKGPWTEEEDQKLIELVEKNGAEKWSCISSFFQDKIGKQCRERWFNHLNPQVKKANWLKEEDWILFIMQKRIGNKWAKLTSYLPGRTDNTIKNYWNSTMRKRIIEINSEYEEMIVNKTNEEAIDIEDTILKESMEILSNANKRFYNEKMIVYDKFKTANLDNKPTIKKLKKILLFRSHSKKTKKRGRKRIHQLIPIPKATSSSLIKAKKRNILRKRDKDDEDENDEVDYDNDDEEEERIKEEINDPHPRSYMDKEYHPSTPIKEDQMLSIEKSAFNKRIFPTTNEKTHSNLKTTNICFHSSIKKPVQIISEDNNLQNNNHLSHNNNNINDECGVNNSNNYSNLNIEYQNENMTPNKPCDYLVYSDTFKRDFISKPVYTSNNKYEGMNLYRTLYCNYSPNKALETPVGKGQFDLLMNSGQKINNTNLDKMFFSTIPVECDTPIKQPNPTK